MAGSTDRRSYANELAGKLAEIEMLRGRLEAIRTQAVRLVEDVDAALRSAPFPPKKD